MHAAARSARIGPRANVRQLAPRWIYQTGIPASFQATPLVVDGVMYLALPYNHVVAIDAVSGQELWRYEHQRVTDKMCCGPASRGLAIAYGKVFIGTVDARLLALDARTGKPVWDVPLATDTGPTEAVELLERLARRAEPRRAHEHRPALRPLAHDVRRRHWAAVLHASAFAQRSGAVARPPGVGVPLAAHCPPRRCRVSPLSVRRRTSPDP